MNETVRFQVMANNSLDLALETQRALLLRDTARGSSASNGVETTVKWEL